MQHQIFVKGDNFFSKHYLQSVVCSLTWFVNLFEKKSCGRQFVFSNALASFKGSAWVIHSFLYGDFYHGEVSAIHSFRGENEQIIVDKGYLLKTATFLEDLPLAFNIWKGSLFNSLL